MFFQLLGRFYKDNHVVMGTVDHSTKTLQIVVLRSWWVRNGGEMLECVETRGSGDFEALDGMHVLRKAESILRWVRMWHEARAKVCRKGLEVLLCQI
jgi:hypothetical protein